MGGVTEVDVKVGVPSSSGGKGEAIQCGEVGDQLSMLASSAGREDGLGSEDEGGSGCSMS